MYVRTCVCTQCEDVCAQAHVCTVHVHPRVQCECVGCQACLRTYTWVCMQQCTHMYVYTVCACVCLHIQSVSKYKRGGVCVKGKKTAHRAPTPITRSHSNGRRARPAGGGGWGASCAPKIAATGPPKAVKASSAEPGFPEALAPHPVPALQPLGPSSSCREEPTSLGLTFHPSCQLAFISPCPPRGAPSVAAQEA